MTAEYQNFLSNLCWLIPHSVWQELNGKSVLCFGANGAIGKLLADLLMYYNHQFNGNIIFIAGGRDAGRLKTTYREYANEAAFKIMQQDVTHEITTDYRPNYMIHGASNTHPVLYSTDPIGTITANVIGTKNILDFAVSLGNCRVLFLSSVEVYGENRGDVENFSEDYCGYIDCNTLRAGYPEGKRAGESLIQAYIATNNTDALILRLARVYGFTMTQSDSKALSQFLRSAMKNQDIVLKSAGSQLYSYLFIADAVSSILHTLLFGEKGQAYNAASDHSEITLKDLARLIADEAKVNVVYQSADSIEKKGYSTATKALLDTSKIKQTGWESHFDIHRGINITLKLLRGV